MADTMNFGPEWLRTLSSGGGSKSPSGGGGPPGAKSGGTSDRGAHQHSPIKHSQSHNSFISPSKQSPTPTVATAKKFPLATHRYGKEELLQLFSEDAERPEDVPHLSPLTKPQLATPLSFMPLSEEEQVALSGGMNSETVYGGRGRGGYFRGRGRGRGRGEYNRSSSYSGEEQGVAGGGGEGGRGGGFYYRGGGGVGGVGVGVVGVGGVGGGGSDVWNTEGRGRGGSRALRDGNWRSPTTPDDDPAPGWGNQRQQQPPPSPASGVPPRNAWGKKDATATGQTGQARWHQPGTLPEWAGDNSTTASVGTFDSSGTFSSSGEKLPAAGKVGEEGARVLPSLSSHKQPPQKMPGDQFASQPLTNLNESEKMGLGRMVMKDHQTPPPGPAQLTKSLPPLPPPKSHSVTTPTASVFPTATEPLPDPVRPLSLSTSLVPVTSVNPATIAESLPTVIGPTAHLASGAVSGDGHMISRGVSHDQQKGHLFSSSTEEDQMRHIEKATEALLYTEEDTTPSPSPITHTPSSVSAPPTSSLPPSHPPPTSAAVDPEQLNQWLYKDPQGETQGPFQAGDMRDWFNAGYFAMDLMIKRSCDSLMLPLGQMIRIWGRIPFQQTGHPPPPIRPEEPFWHRLFQQQFILQQQQQQQQQQHKQQQQQQQQLLTPQRMSQELTENKEEQWPDITGGESLWDTPPTRPPPLAANVAAGNQLIQQPKKAEDEARRLEREGEEKKRREAEERKRVEEERERQAAAAAKAAVKQRLEEEEARRRLAEERLRQEQLQREQQERERVMQDQLRREQERTRLEQLRKEDERKKAEEQERLKLAKEQQKKHELYLQQQQQELQKKQQIEQQKQQQLRLQREAGEQQQHLQRPSQQQPAVLPWLPQTTPTSQQAPSLLQIQQEEETQAKEVRYREEKMRSQQVKPQPQQPQLGWGKSSTKKPKSLVEIQQEQQTDPRELTTPTSAGGRGPKGKPYFTFGTPSSPNPPPNVTNWSSLAGKKAPPTSWGGQPYPPNEGSTASNQKEKPPFKIAENELDEVSFWDDCAREVKTHPSRSRGNQSGPSWGEGGATKKKGDREEENIRRLFSVNSATEEFNLWCERELKKFSTDVDAQTFVSFLLEVDSVYEVHDYIKSYLGETGEAHEFAKSFLDRRQKIKPSSDPPAPSQGRKSRPKNSGAHPEPSPVDSTKVGVASVGGEGGASFSEGTGSSRSSKKKKKKMQKVNAASLLGFTVNSRERPNMGGEIQSAKDAV